MVEVITLITELGDIRQDQKSMGKTTRDQELYPVFRCQNFSMVFSICFRVFSEVNSHIENCAADHAYQLCLGKLFLKVKATQYPPAAGTLIILNKAIVQPGLFHIITVVGLHKITSAVSMDCGRNDTEAFDAVYIVLYLNLSHSFFLFFYQISRISNIVSSGVSIRTGAVSTSSQNAPS